MEITPLHDEFAAQVSGCSLLDVVCDAAAYRQVREAFEAHSVLVFRDQSITDEVQALFSRAFGPLELTKVGSVGAGTVYAHITNIGPDGQTVAPDDRLAKVVAANQLWHTDSSFKRLPALASMLGARIMPASGGETQFVSTRAAWRRLSDADRLALGDLVVEHSYAYSRERIDTTILTAAEREQLPAVRRRLTWLNPVNGERSLYLASHAGAVPGMPREQARALLAGLTDHATVPASVYRHFWRQGDAVLWDNRATMHRGIPWPIVEPRHSIRTTISATAADGLASVLAD
jgi:alpha-ketoglutarate-dependent 2,4-dichlorophenoxyacetate dioxygenase